MSTAPNYRPHYTIEDYLQWEGDWELWAGIPVAMSPSPNFEHQRIAGNLFFLIKQQLERFPTCQSCGVVSEFDWKIGGDTIVRPDLLIICGPTPDQYLTYPPVFIAEILSPTTAHKDRTAKHSLYESQRVPYYAIIDPEEKTTELLILENEGYTESPIQDDPVELKLSEACTLALGFSMLFSSPSPSTPDTRS